MPGVTFKPTSDQLLSSCNRFFNALAANVSALNLLSFFSTTQQVAIQHYPSSCPHPHTSLLRGTNAIRSYFDLLDTHWTRSDLHQHSISADPDTRKVVVRASVMWTWKKSGRTWTEDFTCTLAYDEALQIISLVVKTESGPATCVMRAVDMDPNCARARAVHVPVTIPSSDFRASQIG